MSDESQEKSSTPRPAQAPGASSDPVSEAHPDPAAEANGAIDEIEALLAGASFEDPVPSGPSKNSGAVEGRKDDAPWSARSTTPTHASLPNFEKVLQEAQVSGVDLLRDVDLEVKIELGRSKLVVEDVLKLVEGSVVELDKLAGDAVDVFVNDRLVARGEVLVLNDNFCVRVSEIVETSREEEL